MVCYGGTNERSAVKPHAHPPLSAVVLAGGQSRRIGCDQAWIDWDGRPLIALALSKIRQLGIAEIFVSGRSEGDYAALGCPVLFDLEPDLGPLGGIERGLCHCSAPLLLVLAVDLPRLTPALLEKLAPQRRPLARRRMPMVTVETRRTQMGDMPRRSEAEPR